MSGSNAHNPFAAALHPSEYGGAAQSPLRQQQGHGNEAQSYQYEGGARSGGQVDASTVPSLPSSGATASSQHHPHNPFVTSNSLASPPGYMQPPATMSAQQSGPAQVQREGLPTSTSATSATNPFQIPAPSQIGAHDSITDDLAGLDFGNGPTTSTLADTHPASGQASMVQQQAPRSATAADTVQPVSSSSLDQATQTSLPAAGSQTMYAPPPGPPPGHHQPSVTASAPARRADEQRQPFDQMAADEEYARKLWAAEHDLSQRQHGRQSATTRATAPTSAYRDTSTGSGFQESRAAPTEPRAAGSPRDPNAEKQWNTKEIYWQGRSQRIIVQNENGPCSLIALCNVLLLRGRLEITPHDRPAVSYSYLSSLLGEHLIDAISTQGDDALDLEAALSILPQTQEGLDVNVRFDAIDGFAIESQTTPEQKQTNPFSAALEAGSSSKARQKPNADKEKQRGELALFKLCKVPLVHGWLADKSDRATWAAVVERAGDYDSALDRIVAGDELAKGQVVDPSQASAVGSSSAGHELGLDHLSSNEKEVVHDAMLISRFLEATATQLTYPGLLALSTTLERGALYALFRNSHLSVVYRPTEQELQRAAGQSGDLPNHDQPQLYQLVTDATLETEDAIVWESLEDVDGSASRFFDGKFRVAHVSGDFAGRQPATSGGPDEDADMAYAQQLQWQEQQRADRYAQRNQQMAQRRQQQQMGRPGQNTSSTVGSHGNLISRLLANRKQGRKGTATMHQFDDQVAGTMGWAQYRQRPYQSQATSPTEAAGTSSNLVDTRYSPERSNEANAPGEEIEQPSGSGKGKWWKRIL